MDIIRVIATVIMIAALIYVMSKKFNGSMTLLIFGLVGLAIMTIIKGSTVLPDSSTGSAVFDVIEVLTVKFKVNLPATTLQVMAVMGYVAYMNTMKASQMLTALIVSPLQKMKSKYVPVILAMILGVILRVFIPSQVSLSVLYFATMYPVFLGLGFSRLTSVCICILGTAPDWGPGCPNTGWCFNQDYINSLTDIASFFIKYQLPVILISAVCMIVTFVLITRKVEGKTLAAEQAQNADTKVEAALTVDQVGVPKFYAILPLLPIVMVLIFSKLIISSISISVATAHFVCFIVAFIINMIFSKKTMAERFNDAAEMWNGMGKGMASAGVLVATGTTFSAALTEIGGITVLMNALAESSLGGGAATVISGILTTFIAFATGSGAPGLYTAVPLMPAVAEATGANLLGMIVPVLLGGFCGRSFSIVAPAVLIGCATGNVSPTDIMKRNIVPMLVFFVVGTILSIILFV